MSTHNICFYKKSRYKNMGCNLKITKLLDCVLIGVCLFVLRFYGPVNPMGSCRAQSVYLTTHLLGRFSPLSG